MGLPHYNQDQTSRKGRNFEPVQTNLFEVTILPPSGVANAPLLLQHINSISGLELYKEIAPVEQKYKWITRSFGGTPDGTAVDVVINFSLNLNEANEAYLYKSMRQWYNLRYNPNDGSMGLKKDYVGSIVIVQFNRAGDIFRTVTLEDCQISSALGFTPELNYETKDAATLEVTWRCDVWKEVLV